MAKQDTKPNNPDSNLLEMLLNVAGIPTAIGTAQAAAILNRMPHTLHKWASKGNGPIKPIRINGRLQWRLEDIQALLIGGDA